METAGLQTTIMQSNKPFLLAINYHYIGEKNRYPYSGIIGVTPCEFEQQLNELALHVDFVSAIDIELAVRGERKLPGRAVVITFDDGLREQYTEAVPILVQRKIPFIFFVNSRPLAEQRPCFIHKLHYLRSILSPEQFLGRIRSVAQQKFSLRLPELEQGSIPPQYYPYDDPQARSVKYLLNFALPTRTSVTIVDHIFKEQIADADFCHWFYMGKKEVKELHGELGVIGVHGHSHLSLASLSESEARREIADCVQILGQIVGPTLSCISYPYGYRDSVSPQIADLARESSLKFGFTMEMCFNHDLSIQPLLLGRINNNEAPGHPQAAFSFVNNTPVLHTPSRVSLHRKWFVDDLGAYDFEVLS